MKFITALLLPFFALASASPAHAQTAPKAKGNTSTTQIKTSAVCDMCKVRLEKSLAYEKGVQSVNLDVPSQVLTVTYRADKTNEANLRTAVQKTGYDADKEMADARAYDRLPDCCKKTMGVH